MKLTRGDMKLENIVYDCYQMFRILYLRMMRRARNINMQVHQEQSMLVVICVSAKVQGC